MTLRLAAASAAMLLAACADLPALEGCTCDADCGEGSTCFGGACVVNGAPSAGFEPPAGATTHRLIRFTATTRDPEGGPVTTRWSFRPVADGCDAEPDPARDDSIDVVFWCAGRYEATLVPVDAAGLEGAAVVHAFDVAASVGAPSVVGGPTLPAAHRCELSVPRCAVLSAGGEEALPLEADAADPDGETLHFEWRAIPPATSRDDPTLHVTFLPDAAAPGPLVAIENGGGPIAGTWRFRVRAVDPGGLIGEAHVTVEVANTPPVAAPTAASLPHRYEGGAFVAAGDAPVGVVDPDGDALAITASLSDAPPSCAQSVQPAEGGYRLAISCADPGDLIGPARALRVVAIDVHGAALHFELPVTVENRPPTFGVGSGADPGAHELDHGVTACTLASGERCFVAEGSDPFLVADPDGDPVGGYALSAAAAADRPTTAAATWLDGGVRRFRFEAPVDQPLEFRGPDGASGFTLAALAHDPWEEARATLPVRIRNRAPVVVEEGPVAAVPHRYDRFLLRYSAEAPGPRFADPDGDPLSATVDTVAPCQSATLDAEGRATVLCARDWDWRSTSVPPLRKFAVATEPAVLASDGWDVTASPARITILDRPPVLVAAESQTLEGCDCGPASSCPANAFPLARFVLFVSYLDPDGDPALVTPSFSASVVEEQPPVACIKASCAPYLYVEEATLIWTAHPSAFGSLTADTGAATATATGLIVRFDYSSLTAPTCP
jgi:hypothetical protein